MALISPNQFLLLIAATWKYTSDLDVFLHYTAKEFFKKRRRKKKR